MSSSTPKTETERGGIVPDAVVLELYQKMLTVFYVEERLKIFDRLAKVSTRALGLVCCNAAGGKHRLYCRRHAIKHCAH
jgi:hypothetical protein